MRFGLILLAGLTAARGMAVTNSITLRNNGGTVSNYPFQFARPFARGEIAAYPQIGVCANSKCTNVSMWLTTQADVKVRWDDGSVKHAIISVVIPSLHGGSTTYTFRNQEDCNCGSGETRAQMLSDGYDFDARMEFMQNGTTKVASARKIVSDWAQTTLAADVSAGTSALTVANGAAFPAVPFPITVGSEEMQVTSKGSGNNWTVTRGFNGTPAAAHASGDPVADQRVRYWVAGTQATTVEVGDFSQNHLYDLGWQPAKILTLTANLSNSATSISVDDAAGISAPFYARMYRPVTSGSNSSGNNSEDIYVCAIDKAATPPQLIIGSVGCANSPSVTGRHLRGSSAQAFVAGDKVHPDNAWKEPDSGVYQSIKPIFYVTFWPSIHKVYVRFVAEIADTERLQDQVYDLTLKTGAADPRAFYSGPQVQRHATRFTKTAWVGAAPPVVDVIHNVAYLSSTGLIWNWDPSRNPSTSSMDSLFATYSKSSHAACGDPGTLQRAMGAGGARPEIAPENQWFVDWLYTGYDPMRTMAFGNADLSSCGWTAHLREGNPAKHYDRAKLVSGFGKPVSTSERRTVSMAAGYNFASTAAADRMTPVGPFSTGGWKFDLEHLVNLHIPLYIVTGDHFYLEEGLFYESMACLGLNGSAVPPQIYGRGPTGAECWVVGSLRAQAWNLRYKSELAVYLPDSMSPEKTLSTNYVADSVAPMEATLGLSNSYPNDPVWTAMYNYGATYTVKQAGYRVNGAPSPMGLLRANQGAAFAEVGYGIDTSFVGGASSLFEMAYLTVNLGLTRDLGLYPVGMNKILGFAAKFYNHAATDPIYNPYLLAAGRVPATYKSNGQMIDNWADIRKGYFADKESALAACHNCPFPIWQGMTSFPLSSAVGGYDLLSMAAIAQLADQEKGKEAWIFAASQLKKFPALNDAPQWALLPRSAPTLSATPLALDFSCFTGGSAPPSQTLAFSTGFDDIDDFSITRSASWLSVSPESGTAAQNLTVSTSCSGLMPGYYPDRMTISSGTAGVLNSPLDIDVGLTVWPSPAVKTAMRGARISGHTSLR